MSWHRFMTGLGLMSTHRAECHDVQCAQISLSQMHKMQPPDLILESLHPSLQPLTSVHDTDARHRRLACTPTRRLGRRLGRLGGRLSGGLGGGLGRLGGRLDGWCGGWLGGWLGGAQTLLSQPNLARHGPRAPEPEAVLAIVAAQVLDARARVARGLDVGVCFLGRRADGVCRGGDDEGGRWRHECCAGAELLSPRREAAHLAREQMRQG